MATKVKPSRLQITGTPQAWNVPVYVDQDTFQRWAWWWGGGDVTWPASATDWHLAVFDWATGKIIKDWGAPTPVIDNLNSTSSTSSLSANQGKVLNDKIEDLFWLWKFLSLWDATTWLPISFPLDTPYTYNTWDYFLVDVISSATPPVNYKPNGSSYTWTASSTTESDELEVWDVYIYDGSAWLLQSNHWKTVTFANIAWDPYDNTNLANALADKQDELISGTNIRTINWTSILWSWNITTPTWDSVILPLPSVWDDERELYAVLFSGKSVIFNSWSSYYQVWKFIDNTSSNQKFTVYASNWCDGITDDATIGYVITWELQNWILSVTQYTRDYFTALNKWVKVFSYDAPLWTYWNISSALDWQDQWWQVIFKRNNYLSPDQNDTIYYVSYWDIANSTIYLLSETWTGLIKSVVTYNASWQVTNVTTTSLGWWIQEAPNSPITWIKYVWRGTEAQYAALSQYYTDVPWDTEFHTF